MSPKTSPPFVPRTTRILLALLSFHQTLALALYLMRLISLSFLPSSPSSSSSSSSGTPPDPSWTRRLTLARGLGIAHILVETPLFVSLVLLMVALGKGTVRTGKMVLYFCVAAGYWGVTVALLVVEGLVLNVGLGGPLLVVSLGMAAYFWVRGRRETRERERWAVEEGQGRVVARAREEDEDQDGEDRLGEITKGVAAQRGPEGERA
ncbi:hypothetical protein CAC42_3524 [Sphaceloma murrayae]|uniref:Uncharacterized protein n=1 Tax=Sphaceloma murrayae TaxID=2082308 RepID=A0A2K1R1L1_9PEZI|nr:hypothetical protein CAC42_3524 [Sphaceloma murrayae]